MKTFLISYDLGSPETISDYTLLSKQIKSLYTYWARPLKSVWLIKSDSGAAQIRDTLKSVVDSNDKLMVVELSGNWGTFNVSKEVTDWMKNNL